MDAKGFFSNCILYNALMDLHEIGAAFREARRSSGRSQSELASDLGMSRATLSALENGRCPEIGVRKLTVLLQAVGLDLLVAPRRARPTVTELRAELRGEKARR
jgi:HTH-type transcriptional regulator / antitoxin HipB